MEARETHPANNGYRSLPSSPSPPPPPCVTSTEAEKEEAFLQRMLDDDKDDAADVKGISMKEASLLRLDGCRVRRTHTSCSASPSPGATLVPPLVSSEMELSGVTRSHLRVSSRAPSRSPYNAALETSQAILENMAADTAASVASCRRTPEAARVSPQSVTLTASTAAAGFMSAIGDAPTAAAASSMPTTTTASHNTQPTREAGRGSVRQAQGDSLFPGSQTANAMIRRQASFFSSSNARNEVPGSYDSDTAAVTASTASVVAAASGTTHPKANSASSSSTCVMVRPQHATRHSHTTSSAAPLGSPNAFASVSEMLTESETVTGTGVLRQHYGAQRLPLPGETYDANHDLQHLFAKLNAPDLTRPNCLNQHDDDEEEDEMNTVLYNLKGTAAAAKQRHSRPSDIAVPPTPDIALLKEEATATRRTPLVPFQTWRFPSLGGKTRDSALSPYSTLQTPAPQVPHRQQFAPQHGQGDINGISLLSPVDWRGSRQEGEEGSSHPWSETSSAVSSRHAKASFRKGTTAAQSGRRTVDGRRESSAQDSAAADTPFRQPRKSVTFPAVLQRDSVYSNSLSQTYHRTFDMVCSAYERLQRRQHTRKSMVSTRTPLMNSAATSPAVTAAPTPRAGGTFHRSPSLSTSLLRSSGYYSFGHRVSLSHHNRQTIGEVPPFLGSMSNLHVGVSAGTRSRSAAMDTLASMPAAVRRPTRRLSDAIISRIKARPLLQTTLFLQHNMTHMLASGSSLTELCPPPQRSVTTAPRTSIVEMTTSSATDVAAHHLIHTQDSFFHTVKTETSATSTSDSTSAPPGKGTSSSHLGRTSNSSRVTLLEVDGLAEASGAANARLSQAGATEAAEVAETPPFMENYPDVSPAAATGLRRVLTEVGELQRHTHTIDEVEREVDNENGDLVVHVGMLLMGWLEVVSLLGCGSFGQVFLCKDLRMGDGHFVHPAEIDGEDFAYWNCSHAYLPFGDCDNAPTHDPLVAVKVVKSIPLLENQSVLEAEMLVLIGAQTAESANEEAADERTDSGALSSANGAIPDPPQPDPRCQYVTKVLADGVCYGHHCIIMERYGANLYEYVERNDHNGLPMYQIRSVGQQLFSALTLLHDRCHIIHADIKPENMLLTLDSCRSHVALSRPSEAPEGAGSPSTPKPQPSPSSLQHNKPLSLGATPMEKSLLLLGKSAASPSSSVVQTANGVVMEKMRMLAPQPVRVQALNHPSHPPSRAPASTPMAPTNAQTEAMCVQTGCHASDASADKGNTPKFGDGAEAGATPPGPSSRLQVKLIDFSSSCYDGGPFYTYIQSRYYRAPEVIVGSTYGSGIDSWSAGCLLAELLLGIPLLPGCNDHHQLTLIEETIGPLPQTILRGGAETMRFYSYTEDPPAAASGEPNEEQDTEEAASAGAARPNTLSGFQLVSREEFFRRSELEPMEYRRFFTHKTLAELVRHCPLSLEERRMSNGLPPYASSPNSTGEESEQPVPNQVTRAEILKQRFHLFDLLRGLLNPDPNLRLNASQALQHPFFSAEWTYLSANGLA